jgi:hypothetical protein
MALAAQYQTFRTTFNPECLATGAELHYITSLVTHKESTAIVKHLAAQARELKKKNEEVLSTTEGSTQLFQEIETTIEFVTSGGGYLPGLDDNLVADQEATLPIASFPLELLPQANQTRDTSFDLTVAARSSRSDSTGTRRHSSRVSA